MTVPDEPGDQSEEFDTCAHKDCKPPKPVTVRFDHPVYDSRYGTCAEHEPRRHEGAAGGCGGHIIGGECHCP